MNKQPLIQQILQGMQNFASPSDYWLTSKISFPELKAAQLIIQNNNQSVWEHTMLTIDLLPIKNPITLLSCLFHDLGKICKDSINCCIPPMNNPLLPRFPEHSLHSAVIAKTKLKEWQASPYLIDRIVRIVLMHMYDINNTFKEKTIRKFIADVGLDNVDNWFAVRIADSRSYTAQQKYRNHMIEPFRRVIMLYLEQQPDTDQSEFSSPGKSGTIQIKGGDV